MNCKRILRMVGHFKVALSIQPYFTGGVCKVTRNNQFCVAIETYRGAVRLANLVLLTFCRSKVRVQRFLSHIIRGPVCAMDHSSIEHHKNRSSSPEMKQVIFASLLIGWFRNPDSV